MKEGIVDKSGAWYSYNGDRIGQGKDNVRNFLKDNPQIAGDIERQLREKILPSKADTAASEEAQAEAEA